MKKRKVIMVVVILGVLATTIGIYQYVFNSEHRNIAQEKATISITASALQSDFSRDEELATETYLDQVVAIKGTITETNPTELILNDKVLVTFSAEIEQHLTIGTTVVVKGRCLGFDELLEMVKIDQATLTKRN